MSAELPRWLRLGWAVGLLVAGAAVALPAASQPAAATAPAAAPSPAPAAAQVDARLERLRRQLEQVLKAAGLPDEDERRQVARRLDDIARASSELAKSLSASTARLEARNLEVQAYRELALREREAEGRPARADRLGQMRSAAREMKRADAPGGDAIGDFWLLQADLMELAGGQAGPEDRQALAVRRLEQFLAQAPQADDAVGRAALGQAQLALLRLYDQRGQSDRASRLAAALEQDPAADAGIQLYLREWFGYRQALDQRFSATLKTADGKTWSSADHLGRVILLHFYADWFEPSREAAGRIQETLRRLGAKDLAVLSVRLEGAAPEPSARRVEPLKTPWPLYVEGPGQVSLSRMFAVRSLPRLVLIDARGRVASVGGSAAMLEQLEPLLKQARLDAESRSRTAAPAAGSAAGPAAPKTAP